MKYASLFYKKIHLPPVKYTFYFYLSIFKNENKDYTCEEVKLILYLITRKRLYSKHLHTHLHTCTHCCLYFTCIIGWVTLIFYFSSKRFTLLLSVSNTYIYIPEILSISVILCSRKKLIRSISNILNENISGKYSI